jgi:hypothetical protein
MAYTHVARDMQAANQPSHIARLYQLRGNRSWIHTLPPVEVCRLPNITLSM